MKNVEFTAVILAATCGARLYPLTNDEQEHEIEASSNSASEAPYFPKHLLPLAGKPLLHHLLEHCAIIGMDKIVIAISSKDDVTLASLEGMGCIQAEEGPFLPGVDLTPESCKKVSLRFHGVEISLVTLLKKCGGSADALRCISSARFISERSHVMVLPADLVTYGQLSSKGGPEADALGCLADVHRREYRVGLKNGIPLAVSLMLADVGEEDANGTPLKESAKAKKGGFEREIEYIGVSTINHVNRPPTQRVILKQSKYSVEDDEENVGATPKLHMPKARLHAPMNQIMIKTSWSDLHVFCLSPWVVTLLNVKCHMKDLGKEFIPYLVSRQFRGLKASFGVNMGNNIEKEDDEDDEANQELCQVMRELRISSNISQRGSMHGEDDVDLDIRSDTDYPFLVSAHILTRETSKLMLRACTTPAYLFACREVVSQAIAASKAIILRHGEEKKPEIGALYLPEGTSVNTKFNSITLPGATIGEKVPVKASTIGRGVKIGKGCRLNNVIVHDNVTIGENCVLQNSVLSAACTVGNDCNLKECQVGSKAEVAAGTKEKNEAFERY